MSISPAMILIAGANLLITDDNLPKPNPKPTTAAARGRLNPRANVAIMAAPKTARPCRVTIANAIKRGGLQQVEKAVTPAPMAKPDIIALELVAGRFVRPEAKLGSLKGSRFRLARPKKTITKPAKSFQYTPKFAPTVWLISPVTAPIIARTMIAPSMKNSPPSITPRRLFFSLRVPEKPAIAPTIAKLQQEEVAAPISPSRKPASSTGRLNVGEARV